jgi:anti-sigma factor RsiW
VSADRPQSDHAENIAAYALGALPELEAQVFERHLMSCGECQEELLRLNEAVEALPRSVTPHSAPASLRASLMETVNAEAAPARAPRRFSLPGLPRLRPAIAWAAAACMLAAGAGYGVSELGRDDSDGGRTLSAEIDEERLGAAGSASLAVPDDDGPGSVLMVSGLPDPGTGRAYQVWVERDGAIESAAVFDVDAGGNGAAAVPQSLDDVTAVMVTREPRGGSSAPSERPILRVQV